MKNRTRAGSVLVLTASLLASAPVGAEARAADAAEASPDVDGKGSAAAAPPADEKARASALFDEAVSLASGGNFPAACAKLEASLAVYDAVGTSFHLAGCWQKIGRTASAHALFQKVAHKTFALGQTERAEAARARMDALAPKLSHLRVDVDPSVRAARLEIKRNGEIVPESDWGKSIPVDRGSYEISVSAEKKQAWSRQVEVTDPGITYALAVPELADVAPPPKKAAPRLKARPKRPQALPEPEESGSGRRVLAYSLGGVGVLGVAAGAWFGLTYRKKNERAEGICPASVGCTNAEIAEHGELVSDAKKARTFTFVGAGIGGLALAGAGYFFFSEPSEKGRRTSAIWAEPLVSDEGSLGAALRGRF